MLLRFAVFGIETKLDLAACALLGGVHHASIERAGVNMQAHCPLVEFSRVDHAVYGIYGIDGTRLGNIHLNRIQRLKLTLTSLQILLKEMKILHAQAPKGGRHPTILVAVVVHGTGLANFPADGYQLIQRSAIDQIARIVLAIPG